jgi:CHAT domain
MIRGKYGAGRQELPRVLHLSVARYRRSLPKPGKPLPFLVSIHEEGTGITWQQNVTVDAETERWLLEETNGLHLLSLAASRPRQKALERAAQLGARLWDTFIGPAGEELLAAVAPTAVLLDVDETILDLPWEFIGREGTPLSHEAPFGRLVTTRVVPRPGRDPLEEDTVVRILALANPTGDLTASECETAALQALAGGHGGFTIEVAVLTGERATRVALYEMLAAGDYDILHFSAHGYLNQSAPEASALHLADGRLTAEEVLTLPWKSPPYLVFNAACESGRAAGGRRLVSDRNHSNGLAAAFLAAGVSGYAGYFFPVTDAGAGLFARQFYRTLFERENVGLAFLDARREVTREVGDLTGLSAVFYGDAASEHRRDLAMAV